MGTLNIYKGLSEEYRTIKGNASVNELAHELYPELDLEPCIILNEGEQIAPDYILKDNDIVFNVNGNESLACVPCIISP